MLPKSEWTINFHGVHFDKQVGFAGYLFGRDCSFTEAVFLPEANADFSGATFARLVHFRKATFSGQANFTCASFARDRVFLARETDFFGATFTYEAFFIDATFAGKVYFEGTTFSDETKFAGASFSHLADFTHATFSSKAEFDGANFSWVKFDHATFVKDVYFDSVTFSGETNFAIATFAAKSSFINAKMKYTTSFDGAKFLAEPPKFFNAELHEDTVWPARDAWPIPKPRGPDNAEDFIRAYERLKLEIDRLKKHEDELDFFALEMQSRRVWLGTWTGLPIALYGILSDYGRSYVWPLLWLFVTALLPAPAFWLCGHFCILKSLGLSFANALNVFGFRKDFFSESLNSLPWELDFLAAVQTILGTMLLFLFGLGVRNRFRMK